jgi:hypothetical protein
MESKHIPGKARFLSENGYRVTYWVKGIGHVSLFRMDPTGPGDQWRAARPWHLSNWGTTHETPKAAILHAIESYSRPDEPCNDRAYERQEAMMCGMGRFEEP